MTDDIKELLFRIGEGIADSILLGLFAIAVAIMFHGCCVV